MSSKNYLEQHKSREPRERVINSLEFCDDFENALDLGAGNLIESDYLCKKFKKVLAIDNNPVVLDFCNKLNRRNLECKIIEFKDLEFPESTFSYICSQVALPFYGKENFNIFFGKVISWLKYDGIFSFDFFGDRHSWNKLGRKLPFFSKEQTLDFLSQFDLEIISCKEKEKAGSVADPDANIHTIEVVVRKK